MGAIDATAHGLAPGTARRGEADVISLPESTLVEVYNRGGVPLWFAVNPSGDTFVPNTPGCQVVDPGEHIEWEVSGAPKVVVKAVELDCHYQVRRLA